MSRGQVADVRRTAEALQFHSPERLRDGQLSPVDDAFGLAATLYRALTNANPFGQTRLEVMERQQHVLVPITHYGVNDQQLLAILAAALIADPRRRTANVATFRMQLEHWSQQPHFRALPPLEDEESPEDDAAATAMLPMEGMIFDDHSGKFDTARGTTTQSEQRPPAFSASPLGEQDATVMRELPAHIIALAARAASGSSPPGPPSPARPRETGRPTMPAEEDFGQATRIAPAPDLAGMLGMQNAAPPQPPQMPQRPPPPSAPRQPPQMQQPHHLQQPQQPHHLQQPPQMQQMQQPQSQQAQMQQPQMQQPPMRAPHTLQGTLASPHAPPPPVSRPRVPRAFKATQLGVGADEAVSSRPGGPRDGFAPPPATVSTHPPPRDMDDVRTVMHQAPVADLLARAQNVVPQNPSAGRMEPTPMLSNAQPRVLLGDDRQALDEDDDDGGRTVMRDAPMPAGPAFAPPAPPPPREAQWAPAAPPVQAGPFQPTTQTDRPPQPAPLQPNRGPGPSGGFGEGAGVSALISETLAAMGPGPVNGAPMGTPPGGLPPVPGGSSGGFLPHEFSQGGPPPFGVQQQQHATSAVFPSPAGAPLGNPGPGATMLNPMTDPLMMQAPPPYVPAPQAGLVGGTPGPASTSQGGSRVMLVIVCLLVLILAAAVTFLALKFRAQLGF